MVYMEEWGKKEQDINLIKATVNSYTLTVKPLYYEEQIIAIQFKLEGLSNNDPNTPGFDNGLNRRTRMMYFNSKFGDTIFILINSSSLRYLLVSTWL